MATLKSNRSFRALIAYAVNAQFLRKCNYLEENIILVSIFKAFDFVSLLNKFAQKALRVRQM